MATPVELSVVIPVYRSAPTLPQLMERLTSVLDGIGRPYEVIFVDDGSPDESWATLESLQRKHPSRVCAIRLMRNFGQQNALMCGFRQATGRYVVTLDDDLQNPPEEIPKLLDVLERADVDLVYGRYVEKRHSLWRNMASGLSHAFLRWVFGTKVYASSFRVARRELIEAISAYNLNFTMIDGLLSWNTDRITDVEVAHHPRAEGWSCYSLGKLLLHALNLFTNFSLLPLQAVALVGFLTSTAGLTTALYYLVSYWQGLIAVPGYASTLVAILVLGGIQLMALGVMGEYLGRVHLNVNRKPQYAVRIKLERAPAAGGQREK